MKKQIIESIENSINLKKQILCDKTILNKIEKSVNKSINSIKKGGKLIFFGNGGSASDALHLSTEIVVRFKKNRPALPALTLCSDITLLTAMSNDYGFNDIFSRQIEALGNKKDIVFAISTSGKSQNIINGIKAAKKKRYICYSSIRKGGGRCKKIRRFKYYYSFR
ncbi:MAG: SIS domain-containing protein [bacterium]